MGFGQVDCIMDRTSCIDGARKALDTGDYEFAAQHLGRFLELNGQCKVTASVTRERTEGPAGAEAALLSESESQLFVSKQRLEDTIRLKLAAAVEARDDAGVVRILKLGPFLDDDGLQLYVDHLRKVVMLESQEVLETVVEFLDQGDGDLVDFVTVLGRLFIPTERSIDDNMELLHNFLEQDALVYAIKELHQECDSLAAIILKKFSEHRKLSELTKDIAGWSRNLASMENTETPDPREVAPVLDEARDLLRVSEQYLTYMMLTFEYFGSAGAHLNPEASNAFKFGPLRRALQELAGFYVVLEAFTLKENVREAIELDKFELLDRFDLDAMTTSMVYDVFRVLQRSTRRAISTQNEQAVSGTLNYVRDILINEYKDALVRKALEPNLDEKLFQAGTSTVRMSCEVAAALNNVEISAECATCLWLEIEMQCSEVFPGFSMIQNPLKSSFDELGEVSSNIIEAGNFILEQVASVFIPRLLSGLDAAAYEWRKAQPAENPVSKSWVQTLSRVVNENVVCLRPLLTAHNFASLLKLIIDGFVRGLTFNQPGGGQLDSDDQTLVCQLFGIVFGPAQDPPVGERQSDLSEFGKFV